MQLNRIISQHQSGEVVTGASVEISIDEARFLFHAIRALRPKMTLDQDTACIFDGFDTILAPTLEQILIPAPSQNLVNWALEFAGKAEQAPAPELNAASGSGKSVVFRDDDKPRKPWQAPLTEDPYAEKESRNDSIPRG